MIEPKTEFVVKTKLQTFHVKLDAYEQNEWYKDRGRYIEQKGNKSGLDLSNDIYKNSARKIKSGTLAHTIVHLKKIFRKYLQYIKFAQGFSIPHNPFDWTTSLLTAPKFLVLWVLSLK